VPKDSVILTLACGKFKFNRLEFGDIEGIPRLLDIGQCNDSYSAIQIAAALAKASTPTSTACPSPSSSPGTNRKRSRSLLTLLYLGIKDIRLGPTLPAFLTPNLVKILVDKFNIMPIKTAQEDLKAILG